MKIMSGNCIRIGESDPFDFGSVHVLPEFQLCIVIRSFILLYVHTVHTYTESGPKDDVQGGWLCTPYFVHRPLDGK